MHDLLIQSTVVKKYEFIIPDVDEIVIYLITLIKILEKIIFILLNIYVFMTLDLPKQQIMKKIFHLLVLDIWNLNLKTME